MYELEVNHGNRIISDLPDDVQAHFKEASHMIDAFVLLPWEEHCTECAMPACYKTCDLYESRKDGKCRRFHQGFERLALKGTPLGYVTRISFKRWASVLAYGNVNVIPFSRARRTVMAISLLQRLVSKLPDDKIAIAGRNGLSSRLMKRVKHLFFRFQLLRSSRFSVPNSFLADIYNPQHFTVHASFVVRDKGPLSNQPYQELLVLKPGFNRFLVPFARIVSHISPERSFFISICPNLLNPEDEGLVLYFGLMSFVVLKEQSEIPKEELSAYAQPYAPGNLSKDEKYIKVVAWDLDNTVWHGILLEDGPEKLRLRDQILGVMKELDRRGIVNSVISKNEPKTVAPLLEQFGLIKYLVFPKVSWQPKSESVRQLIADINVGVNTVAVIDDSPFERQEIEQRCPGVRVYSEEDYVQILYLPEFRPPLSAESSRRREFYKVEEERASYASSTNLSYEEFLRECGIHMRVQNVGTDSIARVHELVQRTNQLNFSGVRYSRGDIEFLIKMPEVIALSIHCYDKFGDYGLVGFCIFDKHESLVRDLMFSCRVQAKGVEHVFLRNLAIFMDGLGSAKLRISYTRTSKNEQAAKVFVDLGFSVIQSDEETNLYIYEAPIRELIIPRDEIISVSWEVGDDRVARIT